MTSKPDSVSTLGYHWTDHTGRPLEPQVHWDATGTTLADTSLQCCPSGDLVLICIIGTPLEGHWKTTGSTLETHWLPTILSPVAFQCAPESRFEAHWNTTGISLNYHWLGVRVYGWIRGCCNSIFIHWNILIRCARKRFRIAFQIYDNRIHKYCFTLCLAEELGGLS